MTEGRRRQTHEKKKRRRSLCRRPWFWLLLLAVCAGLFWWEQNAISTETIEVTGCPAAFDGLRIVVVSDLHGKRFGRDNERLIRKTAALKPDLIAITGDLIDAMDQVTLVPAVAAGLSAIAPTYYVTGNHEWSSNVLPVMKQLKKTLADNGVTVLSNQYVLMKKDGQTLILAGAEDSNGRAGQKSVAQLAAEARAEAGNGAYLVLLSHRNTRYAQYADARVDLTLAGHAHGGQIRLPFTDGLIGPNREWFPQYTAGLYQLKYGQMVVSRGLGDKLPAFRLFNLPDLPLVILRAGA